VRTAPDGKNERLFDAYIEAMSSRPEKPVEIAHCARCGGAIDPDDCYSVTGESGGRAALCRVEHIVAWVLRGAVWQLLDDTAAAQSAAGDEQIVLTRHRSGEAIAETFSTPEELRAWASAGGPWGNP
jgi:hypothetical protein